MISNPEQNQQPLQNLPLASNDKFKTLFIISVILLVLIISVSIFLLLQNKKSETETETSIITEIPTQSQSTVSPTNITENSTENWKIYNSQKYGFKISYPEKIFFRDSCNLGDEIGINFCGAENDNFNPGFGIEPVFINQSQKTITILLMNSDKIEISTNNIINDIKKKLSLIGWKTINDSDLKIPNIAIMGFSKTDDTKHMEYWFFVKDNVLYNINFSYVTGEGFSDTQLQNQLTDLKNIFNTMKF